MQHSILKIGFRKDGYEYERLFYFYEYSQARLYPLRVESMKWRKDDVLDLSLSNEKKNEIFRLFYLEKLYHNSLFFPFTAM